MYFRRHKLIKLKISKTWNMALVMCYVTENISIILTVLLRQIKMCSSFTNYAQNCASTMDKSLIDVAHKKVHILNCSQASRTKCCPIHLLDNE